MPTRSHTIVHRVLETVATAEDVDPVSMTPPLAAVIDPDALTELLEHGTNGSAGVLEVQFIYRGHDVIVSDCGNVELQ